MIATIIILSIITALAIFAVMMRTQLNRKQQHLLDEIQNFPPFPNAANSIPCSLSTNISAELARSCHGLIIRSSQVEELIRYYEHIYNNAKRLDGQLQQLHIAPSETITLLIDNFENLPNLIKEHNYRTIQYLLDKHRIFFDRCLKYPLDAQQRRSIVSDDDNCLVVSSAGSGKTSSIVGKVKYLTEIKRIDPTRILLISYTNKAAAELTERIATPGLRGYTFHKLAIDIIANHTGIKPSICDNTDTLFVNIYHQLLNTPAFKADILEYFAGYIQVQDEWEIRKDERREQLSEQKENRFKAIFPDMDGKVVSVRSEQERAICFALSTLGIKFRYEESYEHPVADATHSQYKPDFSIYYDYDGITKRIYLEHFGIDEHSDVPIWFAEYLNMPYEEANRLYNDGITWKKAAHQKFGTTLITTSSADFQYKDIKQTLKEQLHNAGVPIAEKSDTELYDLIIEKDSKREKAFIRLASTFIALLKSSGKSLNLILKQAEQNRDKKSTFIIRDLFQPIYDIYSDTLKSSNQIDFTDAILQATEICKHHHPVEYDYIIVDEFQDISVDRYNFLLELRRGTPTARLYCVGDDWQSIYRFSGSDMSLFNQFADYFGPTEIAKIETTYRFGEPLVSLSSQFIQRNKAQIQKSIHSFSSDISTTIAFHAYERRFYCQSIGQLVSQIPTDKSIFLLGRYSFDDYYLSFMYQSKKRGNKFFYQIGNREIEFLTVHKSKGLEADYVIILQCNNDTFGFPSLINDDPSLNYVLTQSDQYPYGEERRLFYVAITRAKIKTIVMYDSRFPSVFVNEFLHPEIGSDNTNKYPNANKRWTVQADKYLLMLHKEGKSIRYIAGKMGRSPTSITMRLNKLNT